MGYIANGANLGLEIFFEGDDDANFRSSIHELAPLQVIVYLE
jgi:hypothetical protein